MTSQCEIISSNSSGGSCVKLEDAASADAAVSSVEQAGVYAK